MSRVTFRERMKELRRIYFASRSRLEIRRTAIGWQPDPSYIEDKNKTASGAREFYKVVRKKK